MLKTLLLKRMIICLRILLADELFFFIMNLEDSSIRQKEMGG
jgi:hypothetical protein